MIETKSTKNFKTLEVVIPEIDKIGSKIANLKDRVAKDCGIRITSQDARLVALDGMHQNILAFKWWIQIYLMSANNKQDLLKNLGYPITMMGTPLEFEQIERILFDLLKFGLIDQIYLKIDNLFANVIHGIEPDRKIQNGFEKRQKELRELAEVPNADDEEVLLILRNIRNSFHRNGIHIKDTKKIKIGDKNYDFIKGFRIECASIVRILVLTSSIIDVLENILMAPKIKCIKREIKDPFADQYQDSIEGKL